MNCLLLRAEAFWLLQTNVHTSGCMDTIPCPPILQNCVGKPCCLHFPLLFSCLSPKLNLETRTLKLSATMQPPPLQLVSHFSVFPPSGLAAQQTAQV